MRKFCILKIGLLLCLLLTILCGCEKKIENVSDETIIHDMQEQANVFYYDEQQDFSVEKLEISLRDIKEDYDEIWYSVSLSNNDFNIAIDCYSAYRFYSENGWILDDFYFESEPIITSTMDMKQDAISRITRQYPNANCIDSNISSSSQKYIFSENKECVYCSYTAEYAISYKLDSHANGHAIHTEWIINIDNPIYKDTNWNIEGAYVDEDNPFIFIVENYDNENASFSYSNFVRANTPLSGVIFKNDIFSGKPYYGKTVGKNTYDEKGKPMLDIHVATAYGETNIYFHCDSVNIGSIKNYSSLSLSKVDGKCDTNKDRIVQTGDVVLGYYLLHIDDASTGMGSLYTTVEDYLYQWEIMPECVGSKVGDTVSFSTQRWSDDYFDEETCEFGGYLETRHSLQIVAIISDKNGEDYVESDTTDNSFVNDSADDIENNNVPSVATLTEEKQRYFRVRKTWDDASSQIGAFIIYDNAKAMADANPEYTVYNEEGNALYGAECNDQ